MQATLLSLTMVVLAAQADSQLEKPKRNPFAPSLPYLTREEEENLDRIIDRFILYDTGRLPGEAGLEARREFDKLGPEAIPALIRGLNRAVQIEHSCPTLVISKKLRKMLLASDDRELLEFAADNIGAGVTQTRYASVLRDLRFQCTLRKNSLARATPGRTAPKTPRTMTVDELIRAAGSESGVRLNAVVIELGQRRDAEALIGLAIAAGSSDESVKGSSRQILDKRLALLPAEELKQKLEDTSSEMQMSAIRVVSARFPGLMGDVIERLTDEDLEVRELAHTVLVRHNRGDNLGPGLMPTEEDWRKARDDWREWWKQRAKP